MPALETKDLKQRAVCWFFAGRDGYGEPTVNAPVELRVRWTDSVELAEDTQGNTVTVAATAVVEVDIPVGSLMWLGSLGDYAGAVLNPDTGTGFEPEGLPWPSGLLQVKTVGGGVDIKNRFVRRTLKLSRFTDTLPQVV